MELRAEAKLLRIFLGEADKVKHTVLYDAIVREAKRLGLAGATVWRGITGFGSTSRIRTARILDLSTDLPIVVEIADEEERIDQFLPVLYDLFELAQSGGLMTIENVKVIKYLRGKDKKQSNKPDASDG
jgi:PII-like signaling protein